MQVVPIVPPPPPQKKKKKKKNTIGIWVSIAKEPFMESEKSNWIMKLWLFFYNSVKTPSDNFYSIVITPKQM